MKRRLLAAGVLVLLVAINSHAQPPSVLAPARMTEPAESAPSQEPAKEAGPGVVMHASVCNFCLPSSCGPERIWFQAEYLHWWMREQRVPALVTTSVPGTPFGDVGVLGKDTTVLLFGDEWLGYGGDLTDDGARPGFRVTGGVWLRDDLAVGIEGSYFSFQTQKTFFNQASNAAGDPPLARPYVSPFTRDEQAYLVAFPGALAGDVAIDGSSRLWGADLAVVIDLAPYVGYRTFLLVGCRYLDLAEDFNVNDRSTVLAGGALGFRGEPLGVGDRAVVLDSFDAWSHFLGAQIGLRGSFDWGPMTLDVTAKVAFGTTSQVVEARGFTTVFRQDGSVDVTNGGVLALDTNYPRQVEDEFTILPELKVQMSYNVATNACIHLGYDFLFWHTVVRPAEQISRTVNVAHVPTSLAFRPGLGDPFPTPTLRASDYWAQGISLGLTLRY